MTNREKKIRRKYIIHNNNLKKVKGEFYFVTDKKGEIRLDRNGNPIKRRKVTYVDNRTLILATEVINVVFHPKRIIKEYPFFGYLTDKHEIRTRSYSCIETKIDDEPIIVRTINIGDIIGYRNKPIQIIKRIKAHH